MEQSVSSGTRSPNVRLILAPRGRDAVIAKGILRDARIHADICVDFAELIEEMSRGADVAVVTEEALRGVDTRPLGAWVSAQPPWSDFPFIVLTEHGGGLERNPAAAQLTGISRQRHLPGAAVSSDDACQRRADRAARPPAAV